MVKCITATGRGIQPNEDGKSSEDSSPEIVLVNVDQSSDNKHEYLWCYIGPERSDDATSDEYRNL